MPQAQQQGQCGGRAESGRAERDLRDAHPKPMFSMLTIESRGMGMSIR